MPEIIQTHFEHPAEIKVAPSVVTESPFTLFEPYVEHVNRDGIVDTLDAQESLEQMMQYVSDMGFKTPYTYPLGGKEAETIGSVIDTEATDFLAEVDETVPSPDALVGIITTIARVAEQSGFDRNEASFRASFMYPSNENNVNLSLHSDGLSGNVKQETTSAKVARFVYPLGPGTLIYPSLNKEGHMIKEGTEGIVELNAETIDPVRAMNLARGTEVTQEELESSDEQQVMPGRILGFDPTRRFWHKAPSGLERPILVIDIAEVDSAG